MKNRRQNVFGSLFVRRNADARCQQHPGASLELLDAAEVEEFKNHSISNLLFAALAKKLEKGQKTRSDPKNLTPKTRVLSIASSARQVFRWARDRVDSSLGDCANVALQDTTPFTNGRCLQADRETTCGLKLLRVIAAGNSTASLLVDPVCRMRLLPRRR